MKKIGLVDYYISEWHANNYPAWIKDVNAELLLDYEVAYAWAERADSPVDGVTTDAWCEKMGVTKCETLDELCERSDVIMILAPSNPEKHLPYAEDVLHYGKPTYIDKTFAPTHREAEKIFALAALHQTPFFSTSALRYAEELQKHVGNTDFILTGGGRSLEEYSIHLVEMAVVLLAAPVKRVKAERQGKQYVFFTEAGNGKRAMLVYAPGAAFTVTSDTDGETPKGGAVKSPFFVNLMREILRFYESGVPPFGGEETLEAMRLRDAVLLAAEQPGEWIVL